MRRLFAGVIRWRMGLARFFVLVTAMPLLTLLVGAVTGTLISPRDGWLGLVGSYLFRTFIFGLLIVNLWEETAWGGFMQSRLMARRGLLIGSLLTAIPFFVIHIPNAFAEQGLKDTSLEEAAVNLSPLSPWSHHSSDTCLGPNSSIQAAAFLRSACCMPRSTRLVS